MKKYILVVNIIFLSLFCNKLYSQENDNKKGFQSVLDNVCTR